VQQQIGAERLDEFDAAVARVGPREARQQRMIDRLLAPM